MCEISGELNAMPGHISSSTRWFVGFCVLLNIAALLWFAQTGSDSGNTHSRLATIEALGDYGTFSIDRSRYVVTVDKVQIGGRFYSTKPPILPTVGAILYKPFSMITGRTFQNDERSAVLYVSLTLGALPYLVLLIYFYRFLVLWVKDSSSIAWGFAAFSLSHLGLGYATGINNHVPAAAATFVAFYYAFLVRRGFSKAIRHWLLAGLFAGLAPTLSPWAAAFSLAITVYLATADWRRTLKLFIPASLPFMLFHVALTYVSTGSVLPVYMRKHLYFYPGSFWEPLRDRTLSKEERVARMGFEGRSDPRPLRYFHYLFGHHGLIAMTPVFALSFWSLGAALRRSHKRYAEALAILIPTVLVIAYLGWETFNYGGLCVGFRWMIFAMPLLFLFTATWCDEHRSRRARVLFAILVAAGMFHAGDALRGPWRRSAWHELFISGGSVQRTEGETLSQ